MVPKSQKSIIEPIVGGCGFLYLVNRFTTSSFEYLQYILNLFFKNIYLIQYLMQLFKAQLTCNYYYITIMCEQDI